LSQISDFRSQHRVVDDEVRKRVSRLEEQSLQQDRGLCLLRRELSDLWAAHSRLAAESAFVGETNKVLKHSLCLLQKELTDLRGAHAREIAALSARFAQEVAGLREQFTEDIAKVHREKANLTKPDTAPDFFSMFAFPRLCLEHHTNLVPMGLVEAFLPEQLRYPFLEHSLRQFAENGQSRLYFLVLVVKFSERIRRSRGFQQCTFETAASRSLYDRNA
jgi:hypothetical protein